MDYQTKYGFKPTTNGRELLAACAATGRGLNISRVAFGIGRVPEDVDLADVHQLYDYVTDGAVSRRSHENDRLYLTVQYANEMNRSLPAFDIGEFMVYAIHPETNEETDLIYATMGSYLVPVPAYDPGLPVSVFSLPMVLIVSDDITVTISAQAGLVTYDDLQDAVSEATGDVSGFVRALPFTANAEDWAEDENGGAWPYHYDFAHHAITGSMVPWVVLDEESQIVAAEARMSATARSYSGYVRLQAKKMPEETISGMCYLSGKGGGGAGGTVIPGIGLSYGADGDLNVNVGDGISVTEDNKLTVDTQTVMTDDDLLDEDATEEDLRQILTGSNSEEPEG